MNEQRPMKDGSLRITVPAIPRGPEALGRRWVRFSLPFAPGEMGEDGALHLVSASGNASRLQTRPLARWEDGSARWLDCEAVVREGGEHAVERGEVEEEPEDAASAQQGAGRCTLGNGRVGVVLSTDGDSPVAEVLHEGRTVSAEHLPFRCSMSDASGESYTASNDRERTLRLLSRGPVSAAAEVAGGLLAPDGTRAMSYRLRARVYAGLPVVHMMLWILHDTPGTPMHEVKELAFSTAWAAGDDPVRYLHQKRHGLLSVPRDMATRRRVELRGAGVDDAQIRVHNTECLEDDTEYPYFMGLPLNETQPFLGLSLPGGWVGCVVEDFIQKCPKGLVGEGGEMKVQMWPEWAEVCPWRQGRSRAMEWRLVFGREGEPTLARARQFASATGEGAPAVVPPECYAASGEFHADSVLRSGREGVRRLDRRLGRLTDLDTPIGMWDLGDTREHGYSRTYAAIGRLARRDTSIPARFKAALQGAGRTLDWSNPNQFEPVWSNNEYDVIIAMARQFMRGGGGEALWQQFRWFARHAIEVDFVHHSDHRQLHHGSPAHSADHDRASAYPSHLWSEGLLAYYCLSGDADALDVAVKTGDYIIDYFRDPRTRRKVWKFTRELGWALLHVATLADLTGEARFREMSVELADFFLQQELSPDLFRGMVKTSFAYASLVLGMEAVTAIEDRAEYRDWIVRVADGTAGVIDRERHGDASLMNLNYLVAAYEICGERKYLETGRKILEIYLDDSAGQAPSAAAKPCAMKFRSLCRFLHHAHEEGMLEAFEYRYAR